MEERSSGWVILSYFKALILTSLFVIQMSLARVFYHKPRFAILDG